MTDPTPSRTAEETQLPTRPATTTLRMIDSKVIDAGKFDPIEQGRLRAENFLAGLEPGSPVWCMIDALRRDFVEAGAAREEA